MFSYEHKYHAGCFADIHKHLTLLAILQSFHKKPTPFCVMDTHAGNGIYDLNSIESQKTAERVQGIDKLWGLKNAPHLVKQFLDLVQGFNQPNECRYYPGSPAIISELLREHDASILIEKHPQAVEALREFVRQQSKKCSVHERDSFEAMKALIPFAQKRGLVFIDPSFELKAEYETIVDALHSAYTKFSHGIFALWYPILPDGYHETLLRRLKKTAIPNIWQCEWTPNTQLATGMLGSGMIVINPPWQLDTLLSDTFRSLNQDLFKQGLFKQQTLI